VERPSSIQPLCPIDTRKPSLSLLAPVRALALRPASVGHSPPLRGTLVKREALLKESTLESTLELKQLILIGKRRTRVEVRPDHGPSSRTARLRSAARERTLRDGRKATSPQAPCLVCCRTYFYLPRQQPNRLLFVAAVRRLRGAIRLLPDFPRPVAGAAVVLLVDVFSNHDVLDPHEAHTMAVRALGCRGHGSASLDHKIRQTQNRSLHSLEASITSIVVSGRSDQFGRRVPRPTMTRSVFRTRCSVRLDSPRRRRRTPPDSRRSRSNSRSQMHSTDNLIASECGS
jgi:hypothetical protein